MRVHPLGVFGLLAMSVSATTGCWFSMKGDADGDSSSRAETRELPPSVVANIEAFCSNCHAMPDPASFPRDAWPDEVLKGFGFYYASGRTDLKEPVVADVQAFYVARAPENYQLPGPAPIDAEWRGRYRQIDVPLTDASGETIANAAVSFIDIVDLGDPLGRGILVSDMRHGGIHFVSLAPRADSPRSELVGQARLLGRVTNPAAVRVVDWDADGLKDLVVADLGSFLPGDHDKGRVVWFRQRNDAPGEFEPHDLIAGIGRVASVEIADFDGDGLQDLLVAEFGWQTTGSIFWLKRSASNHPTEGLVKEVIDSRAGTIHVPVADINGDGAPDFVALISQHHERIEAMINDGSGNFRSELIHAAQGPTYGSSGIELVDLNGDGKWDVLATNGDAFDSFTLKPFHGVRWFENRGAFPFQPHEVGLLPGAHRAEAGDLDGDGKLEIVGASFIPRELLNEHRKLGAEAIVVWKAMPDGGFRKHVLATQDCIHATIKIADLDGDGRDEILAGHFRDAAGSDGPAMTIWSSQE
jgi:hypothetical protein